MKRLVLLLLILTPWVMHSMEPEELKAKEVPAETLAKLLERRGGWVTSVEEVLPGDIHPTTATRISQVIAQVILLKGPSIKQFILSQISLPFKDYVGHTSRVIPVKFNSKGDKIIAGSSDGTAKIWDVKTGQLIHNLGGHAEIVWSAMFNPAGDKVVIGSLDDDTAKIWDVATGEILHTLQGPIVQFNSAGDKLLAVSRDGIARIWDVNTGKFIHTLGGYARIASLNQASDKIVTGSSDGTVILWEAMTGNLLRALEGHTTAVSSAAFNLAGDKVVTGSYDTTARIWDTATGELLHTLEGHTDFVISAVFNRAGDKVATGSKDGTIKIWDVATGKLLRILKGLTVSFNPAGDKVVVASRNKVKIWDLEPFLSSEKFLAEDITLTQVAILNDIFELMKVQGIIKALKEKAFERGAPLSPEDVTFDFNKYPHLWDDYKALPEAIKEVFDPYVTKLSPSAQE